MRLPSLGFTLVALSLAPIPCLLASDDAIAVYKTGDYTTAIPLLEVAAHKAPKDPVVHAALLSALVYEGRVEEASDAAEADGTEFPDSPEVTAARGEFAYYMSDMAEAEKLFRAALKLKEQTPRACYGLYRLYYAASMRRTARLLLMRAHEIDADDALITRAWLSYLVPEKRKELLEECIAAHPWFYSHLERDREQSLRPRHERHQVVAGRIERLAAQLEHIAGVKQANPENLQKIDGLQIYAGNDDLLVEVLELGEAGGLLLIVGGVLGIRTRVIATLIQLAVSRQREYLADASGALLTRYPPGLASALRKIAADKEPLEVANKATASLYIASPLKDAPAFFDHLFDTHPPIEERIKRLEAMN